MFNSFKVMAGLAIFSDSLANVDVDVEYGKNELTKKLLINW